MPLRILFKPLLGSKSKIEKEYSETRYVLTNLSYKERIRERYEEILYSPFKHLLLWCADRIRTLQAGSIHLYLGYMFMTLIIVLIWSL